MKTTEIQQRRQLMIQRMHLRLAKHRAQKRLEALNYYRRKKKDLENLKRIDHEAQETAHSPLPKQRPLNLPSPPVSSFSPNFLQSYLHSPVKYSLGHAATEVPSPYSHEILGYSPRRRDEESQPVCRTYKSPEIMEKVLHPSKAVRSAQKLAQERVKAHMLKAELTNPRNRKDSLMKQQESSELADTIEHIRRLSVATHSAASFQSPPRPSTRSTKRQFYRSLGMKVDSNSEVRKDLMDAFEQTA